MSSSRGIPVKRGRSVWWSAVLHGKWRGKWHDNQLTYPSCPISAEYHTQDKNTGALQISGMYAYNQAPAHWRMGVVLQHQGWGFESCLCCVCRGCMPIWVSTYTPKTCRLMTHKLWQRRLAHGDPAVGNRWKRYCEVFGDKSLLRRHNKRCP